jgi:hypothetical protein
MTRWRERYIEKEKYLKSQTISLPRMITQISLKVYGFFDSIEELKGKYIMWHEGHEAGTVFEHDNKKYALIFWWDIIGVKE